MKQLQRVVDSISLVSIRLQRRRRIHSDLAVGSGAGDLRVTLAVVKGVFGDGHELVAGLAPVVEPADWQGALILSGRLANGVDNISVFGAAEYPALGWSAA